MIAFPDACSIFPLKPVSEFNGVWIFPCRIIRIFPKEELRALVLRADSLSIKSLITF
ncbi:MAG: hypothetical protein QG578_384 [Thermodesulfobacteriota bacterium]|nr:hypothetical protein [Thermodesulfobacteriota bacterium]